MKCGSSNIRKAFAGKHWGPHQFPEHRYVTVVRNPAHRLVSCWNHLVRPKIETSTLDGISKFGPHVDFPEWCRWVLAQDPDSFNAHIRPQTNELAGHLSGADGLIWVGQLERMQWLAKGALSDWLGVSMKMPYKPQHGYYHWPDFYDTELLQAVHRYFDRDYKLWMALDSNEHKVYLTKRFHYAIVE